MTQLITVGGVIGEGFRADLAEVVAAPGEVVVRVEGEGPKKDPGLGVARRRQESTGFFAVRPMLLERSRVQIGEPDVAVCIDRDRGYPPEARRGGHRPAGEFGAGGGEAFDRDVRVKDVDVPLRGATAVVDRQ